MATIHEVRYVEIIDVLPDSLLEVFQDAELPWTFGDCHLSCIRPAQLTEWVEEQDDDDVGKEVKNEAVQALDALPDDVLVAL